MIVGGMEGMFAEIDKVRIERQWAAYTLSDFCADIQSASGWGSSGGGRSASLPAAYPSPIPTPSPLPTPTTAALSPGASLSTSLAAATDATAQSPLIPQSRPLTPTPRPTDIPTPTDTPLPTDTPGPNPHADPNRHAKTHRDAAPDCNTRTYTYGNANIDPCAHVAAYSRAGEAEGPMAGPTCWNW